MITAGEFDGVVGDITIVTNRTKMVDFTQPYIGAPIIKEDGIQCLVVGAVVWILEGRSNDNFKGPARRHLQAFPRDSPLAIEMFTAILKLSENGDDLQRIHDKWLTSSFF
ncbi:hypothetical protein GYH30_025595 [Glycine max]|nr:hypothetical protein GYH30_025595 [Glycine max]